MTVNIDMPELRKDPITGRWVIIARERAKRPQQAKTFPFVTPSENPTYCPFCAGAEGETPPEVLSYRATSTSRDKEGWWVRVVPNKYPALVESAPYKRSANGIYDCMSGMGMHEVLIESPHHCHTFAELPEAQIQEIIWALRDRTIELRKKPNIRYVLVFKNWGAEAGASIEHPHSQIMALPVTPASVADEINGAEKYYDYKERCVFCDIIQQELADGKRIVFENDTFLAFMPYAARFPYEICIIPKDHAASFMDIVKNQVTDLATVMSNVFSMIKDALGNVPYNFMVHGAPFDNPESETYYHWHIELIPKLSKVAGFEWGSGFHINAVAPEDACRHILEASVAAKGKK